MAQDEQANESEEWVRVLRNGRRWYWFNRRTRHTSDLEVYALWSCQWDDASGNWYYWRTESADQPVWSLPELEETQRTHQTSTGHEESSSAYEPDGEPSSQDSETARSSNPGLLESELSIHEVTEVWAEMMADVPYYYHREKKLVLDALPPGVIPRWIGHKAQDGSWHYEDTGKTSKEAPLLQSSWIEVGAPVCISGLTKKAHFNWQIGRVVETLAGWYLLRLPESSYVFAVRPDNVEQLLVGSLVELQRLSSAELNGCMGSVHGHNFEALRYHTMLDDGREKAVKGLNLKPRTRLLDIGARITSSSSSSCLQWRGEQICTFIDRTSRRRTYALHLPIGFNPTPRPTESIPPREVRKWPLIVYLHGTGGGTFFTYSKKSLNSSGMRCAGHQFVVVSPRCEWTWRDTPNGWIAELVQALRVLDWIDHQRVYLTGCSMGGMGAWEVGAQSPELFAAVCPVAAHHKNERTALIAHALKSTPVYVVHADTDDTCPMSQEESLWRLLEENSQDFTKAILHNVDHCSIHEHAFCFNEEVYRWFLQRTLPSNA